MASSHMHDGRTIRIGRYCRTGSLLSLSRVIDEFAVMFISGRDVCDLQVFYDNVRLCFKGKDSSARQWIFDGIEDDESIGVPKELSRPSVGQNLLIHTLDIFLGLDTYSPSPSLSRLGEPGEEGKQESFLKIMQKYMPRHHRAFLTHLASPPYPLRDLVLRKGAELKDVYNDAVGVLSSSGTRI